MHVSLLYSVQHTQAWPNIWIYHFQLLSFSCSYVSMEGGTDPRFFFIIITCVQVWDHAEMLADRSWWTASIFHAGGVGVDRSRAPGWLPWFLFPNRCFLTSRQPREVPCLAFPHTTFPHTTFPHTAFPHTAFPTIDCGHPDWQWHKLNQLLLK